MLTLAVTVVWSTEVSLERRLDNSPVRWVSKKPVSWVSNEA